MPEALLKQEDVPTASYEVRRKRVAEGVESSGGRFEAQLPTETFDILQHDMAVEALAGTSRQQ